MSYKEELKEILLVLFHVDTSVDQALNDILELNDAYADKQKE